MENKGFREKSGRLPALLIAGFGAWLVLGFALSVAGRTQTAKAQPKAHATPTLAQALIEDGFKLTGEASEAESALKRLQARPRATVVAAVREELSHAEALVGALAIVRTLGLKELLPELKNGAAKTQDWNWILTLNQLLPTEEWPAVAKVYVERLAGDAAAPVKMAMLSGLTRAKEKVPEPTFKMLLAGSSYEVREEVVRNFIETREFYSLDEQINRFKQAFTVKPYPVRLRAMRVFASLSEAEQKKLSSAVSKGLCDQETNSEVKEVCRAIVPAGRSEKTGAGK